MREVFMKSPEQLAALFAGHVELQMDPASMGEGRFVVCPWRLRQHDRKLYHPSLLQRSFDAVGVRLVFTSQTTAIEYEVDSIVPGLVPAEPKKQWTFDLLVDGQFHQRVTQPTGRSVLAFDGWPAGEHRFELYLYQISPIQLHAIRIDDDADAATWQDDRPRWLTYGSSITQSGQAAGPSETWPALVAREWNLNHTNLGYGGNATLDPIVARMIADLPADAISLCFSVNNYSGAYSQRTWAAAAAGFILNIRDKKPNTPIICHSPIWSPSRETKSETATGMTLVQMRRDIAKTISALQDMGDKHIHYIDGLDLINEDQLVNMPDGLHPNAIGCHSLAKNYTKHAMPWLAEQAMWGNPLAIHE